MSWNKIMIINTSLSLKTMGIYKTPFSPNNILWMISHLDYWTNKPLYVDICVPDNAVEQYENLKHGFSRMLQFERILKNLNT